MKTLKTMSSKRNTYTYIDANGKKYTLKPGDVDPNTGYVLTEEDIRMLHRMDDNEVHNNVKNSKRPVEEWEKPFINEWKKAHPYDDLPNRSNVSLDAEDEDEDGMDDDADKGFLGDASLVVFEQEEPAMIARLREVVEMLRPDQQELYRRILVEGETLSTIAREEDVSVMAIHYRIEKIKKHIKKFFRGL